MMENKKSSWSEFGDLSVSIFLKSEAMALIKEVNLSSDNKYSVCDYYHFKAQAISQTAAVTIKFLILFLFISEE